MLHLIFFIIVESFNFFLTEFFFETLDFLSHLRDHGNLPIKKETELLGYCSVFSFNVPNDSFHCTGCSKLLCQCGTGRQNLMVLQPCAGASGQ